MLLRVLVYKKSGSFFLRQKSYGFTIAQKFNYGDENVVASNWLKIEYVLVRGMGIQK